MKKTYTLLFFAFLVATITNAQVGIGTVNPEVSSILELNSTESGLLITRMTMLQRDAIVSPATGLLIYQTNNSPGFYYFNGTVWLSFGGTDTDWTINGDDMYNANSGNVGIGNTLPSAKLHVTGTTTIPSVGGGTGTTTIFSENFSSYTVNQNHTTNTYCDTNGWESGIYTGIFTSEIVGTNMTGDYLFISSVQSSLCYQDATAILGPFTATESTINISFEYKFREYSVNDSFRVYLYNETTSTALTPDELNINNGSNSGIQNQFNSTTAIVAGQSYSIRFEYIGNYDYGVSIDDVLITENSATTTPTTGNYMFRLEDGQQQDGHVLTSDGNGNATWMAPTAAGGGTDNQTLSITGNTLSIANGNSVTLPTGGGGGGTYSFENGITESAGTVRLGGALTQTTNIDLNSRNLNFQGTGSGNITFRDNTGAPQMTTNFSTGYTNFGDASAAVDADDGSNFTDTYGGGPFTKEFVLGAHNNSSGGTSIALGSIEYIVDGTDELFYEGGAFSPMDDFGSDLGVDPFSGNTRRWDDVNADDFITPTATYSRTSGRLETTKDLKKGLSAILQLKPISYKDEMTIRGKELPESQKEDKLGFYIEELKDIIPEAVKSSDWVNIDESGVKRYVEYAKPSGIKFTQIIPVTVKAIQEQQEQIIDLQSEVDALKNELKLLKELILNKK